MKTNTFVCYEHFRAGVEFRKILNSNVFSRTYSVHSVRIRSVVLLKVIYKGFFNSFIVLYDDRICPEHHFVENRIENFPSV